MIIATIIIYLISLGWMTITTVKKPNSVRRLIAKTVTSLLFIALALIIGVSKGIDSQYYHLLLTALILAFLGDLFLGLQNARIKTPKFLFVIGFLFFFAMQSLYIYIFAFSFKVSLTWWPVIFIPVGVGITIFILRFLEVKDTVRSICSVIYTFVLAGLVVSTTELAIAMHFDTFSTVAFIASIIFATSDYTLLFKYFYKGNRTPYIIVTTICYYLAQLIFVSTLLH